MLDAWCEVRESVVLNVTPRTLEDEDLYLYPDTEPVSFPLRNVLCTWADNTAFRSRTLPRMMSRPQQHVSSLTSIVVASDHSCQSV